MFWDEFGFSFQESLAPTWARRGKRPIFRRVTKERRALSTAVALTLSGKIYKRHFEGSVTSQKLIEALDHLRRHVAGKLILIWDRARIHRSKITKAYLEKHPEILKEELPAYAPELNPESIVMAMSSKVSRTLGLPVNKKCALCWIAALLACADDPICYSASFTQQAFLLGN